MDAVALRDLFAVLEQRRKGAPLAAEFRGADLRGAHLLRADLVGSDFESALFDHASFSGARLGGSNLACASLRGAILNAVDFTAANLAGADLRDARVEGACFAGADLTGADLTLMRGEPASVAGMRLDAAACKRSGLHDLAVIQLWRDGAVLVDIEAFSDQVRRACASPAVAADLAPHSRQVAQRELESRTARLNASRSIPASSQLAAAWERLSSRPPPNAQAARVEVRMPKNPSDVPPAPALPEFRAGDHVLGVRLIEPIGSGCCGTVWSAESAGGERVVVKAFDARHGLGVGAAAFRNGLRSLSRIESGSDAPRVPRLLCVARNELQAVMEYFPNGNSASLLALGWSAEQIVEFAIDMLRQLQKLHELGMLHRCLKPQNVLINDRLEPVLVDMQSVNLCDPESFGDGTYGIYAAPEELIDAGTLSPTADIYAVGRILEFLLLGEDPAPVDRDVRALENLARHPSGIVRIIRKATARDPALRYQWVPEMIDELSRWQDAAQVGLAAGAIEPGHFREEHSLLPAAAPRFPVDARTQHKPLVRQTSPDHPIPRKLEMAIALLGSAVALVSIAWLVVSTVPTPDGVELFGLTLALALGVASFWIPALGTRPLLFRIVVALAAFAATTAAGPEGLARLRWLRTVEREELSARAEAVRYLVRAGSRDLKRLDLTGADLSRADLNRVDFRGAKLRGANLTGATLHEARFEGADVSEADLRSADLFASNADQARGWTLTHCGRLTTMPKPWICAGGRPARRP